MNGIRRLFLLTTALLLLAGCQKTPEENNIFYKGDNKLEEAIQRTAAPSERPADPEGDWALEETYTHNITLKANVNLRIPETEQIPVLRIARKNFENGDELAQIVEAVYPDGEAYHNSHEFSKQDLEEQIIYYKNRIYERQNEQPKDDPTEEAIRQRNNASAIEWLEEYIKELEAQYEQAPDEPPREPPTYQLEQVEDGSMQYSCMVDLPGKTYDAELDFVNADYWNLFMLRTGGDSNDRFTEILEEETEETAKLRARLDAMVQDMGIDYMALNTVSKTGEGEYCFYYTRTYEGIMETYVKGYFGTTAVTGEDIYMNLWQPEYLFIKVDQGEIVSITWESPSQMEEVENENVQLLPWEEIEGLFLKQFNRVFVNQNYRDTTITVERVELGFAKLLIKDTSEYRLVPAWSFFATIRGKDAAQASEQSCIFTINAIDGSFIDRGVMY